VCDVRWRLLDHVNDLVPWVRISGRKAVSLEEYLLLEPFGRQGFLPESLILACCVELARWLVAASSGFSLTATLSEVREFRVDEPAGIGQLLDLTGRARTRRRDELELECRVTSMAEPVAGGTITVAFMPTNECFDPTALETLWGELYGPA